MAISFVGAGAQVAGTGATLAPSFPASYTPVTGHFAVVIVGGKATDATEQPADPSGWTFRSITTRVTGASVTSHLATYYRVLAAGDSAPVFAIPTTWQGGTLGNSVQMLVYSGVDTSNPFDVNDVIDDAVAAATYTGPSITPVTNGAMVVQAVATSDDNALDLTTPNSFTARMSGTGYDTTNGNDHSVGSADQLKATAGPVSMGTWTETVNGTDAWLSIAMALRPSSGAPATVTPGLGVLALTGFAATVGLPRTVVPGLAQLTVTGFAPVVVTGPTVVPGVGALVLTGFNPTLGLPRTVVPGMGQLTITGFAPTITSGPTVTPGVGGLVLTGFSPTIGLPRTVVPGLGQLIFTGFAPVVNIPRTVTPGLGVLTLTGFAPAVAAPLTVRPGLGVLTITGFAPVVFTTTQVQGWVEFDVIVESTAGTTFSFRWAQLVNTALPLTVKAGSYLEYAKIS